MSAEHEQRQLVSDREPKTTSPVAEGAQTTPILPTRGLTPTLLTPVAPPSGETAHALRQAAVLHAQRVRGNRYTSGILRQTQPAPVSRVTDQHAHAQLPSAAQQQAIHTRLHPAAAPAPGGAPGGVNDRKAGEWRNRAS